MGLGAAIYVAITLKDGKIEQTNFDGYRVLRIDEMPKVEVHIVQSPEAPTGGRAGRRSDRASRRQRGLRRHRHGRAR